VATAAEKRLNIWRRNPHTSFEAASASNPTHVRSQGNQ
jgi:hypothetical protein